MNHGQIVSFFISGGVDLLHDTFTCGNYSDVALPLRAAPA